MVVFHLWVNLDVPVMITRGMLQSHEKMVLDGSSHAKWFWKSRHTKNGFRDFVTQKMILEGAKVVAL